MLLYIGAGTDIRPITRYGHAHKEFIYVDGMPNSRYYEETYEMMLSDIIKSLEKEDAFDKILNKTENGFIILLKSGGKLIYFLNTPDIEMFKNLELCQYLENADTLFMAGYFPYIERQLPNLKKFISGVNCHPGNQKGVWRQLDNLKYVKTLEYDHIYDNEPTYFVECEHCGEDTLTLFR